MHVTITAARALSSTRISDPRFSYPAQALDHLDSLGILDQIMLNLP